MTATTECNDIEIAEKTIDQQFEDAEVVDDDLPNDDDDNNGISRTTTSATSQFQQQQQQPKLVSKWIQRLLHPELKSQDNDVVVIQSPIIIPLNDMYIQEFGRRIRDDEVTFGIEPIMIDHKIRDNDDDDDDDEQKHDDIIISTEPNDEMLEPLPIVPTTTTTLSSTTITTGSTSNPKNNNNNNNKKLPRKVKITNIKYTTTAQMIEETLEEQFGLIEYMDLIMQQQQQQQQQQPNTTKASSSTPVVVLNSGLAYVTFMESDAANRCVDELKKLDQRPVTVMLLTPKTPIPNSGIGIGIGIGIGDDGQLLNTTSTTTPSGGGAGGRRKSRYWSEIDLSIKCYQCGQAGHMSYDCTTVITTTTTTTSNQTFGKARKPCPLCASTTDHNEIFQCPNRHVCFNCGIPGHIAKGCNHARITRNVCTICYAMNHHTKYSCPWLAQSSRHRNAQVHPSISTVSTHAICASCGRTGHFLCQELKWFYGLKGVSCCNCGMPDHISTQCSRPNLEECARNQETVLMEIERAATVRSVELSVFEANSKQQQQQQQPQQHQQYQHQTQQGRNNNGHQYRAHDNNYRRGGGDGDRNNGGGIISSNGQSRYGSIDQSRNNNNNSNNMDRGRQLHRHQPQQPQFRPFKSVPPPPKRHDQQNHSNNNNNSDPHGNNKRGRGRNDNDSDVSSPQYKRRRWN